MIKKQLILLFFIYCISINIVNCQPNPNMALPEIQGKDGHEYKLYDINEIAETPTLFNSTITLWRAGLDIGFNLKVSNIFSGLISRAGKDVTNEEIEEGKEWGDKYKISDLITTTMIVSGEDKKNEDYMINSISNLKRIRFDNNLDELTIYCVKNSFTYKKVSK